MVIGIFRADLSTLSLFRTHKPLPPAMLMPFVPIGLFVIVLQSASRHLGLLLRTPLQVCGRALRYPCRVLRGCNILVLCGVGLLCHLLALFQTSTQLVPFSEMPFRFTCGASESFGAMVGAFPTTVVCQVVNVVTTCIRRV